jgi:hypothetical protein
MRIQKTSPWMPFSHMSAGISCWFEKRVFRASRKGIGAVTEEIMASLIGSLIAEKEADRQLLYYKAVYDAVANGMDSAHAVQALRDLRDLLEKAL